MKKPTIILLALIRWDEDFSSTPLSLAKALDPHANVYLIDYPFTLKDVIFKIKSKRIKSRLKAQFGQKDIYGKIPGTNITTVTPPWVYPINFLNTGPLYNFFLKINEKRVFKAIKKLIKEKNLDSYTFLNSFAPFYGQNFNKYIKPTLHIYQSVDAIGESTYIKKHGPFLEKEYVKKADLTITTSTALKNDLKPYGKPVVLVPNAADFELFNRAYKKEFEKPAELSEITSPIICYTGNICERTNYQLLLDISSAYPEYTLLMVGPVNTDNSLLKQLKKRKNVCFTGKKNLDELPAFLQYADCAIIPFKMNALTARIYPLKINEYLATGIPVVSTPFSIDLNNFSVIITIDQDGFTASIRIQIESNTPEKAEKRVNRAAENTWEKRAEQILNLIAEYS